MNRYAYPANTSTADQGLSFVCNGPIRQRQSGAYATVGFVAPTYTYDEMRALNARAIQLDAQVKVNPAISPPFKIAWTAWFRDAWTPFYNKFANDETYSSWSRLSGLWGSEDIKARADAHQAQFASLLADYNKDPATVNHRISPPESAQDPKGVFGVPWWLWLGLGGATAGLGYLGYKKYQEGKAKAAYVKKKGPAILSKYLGPEGKSAYEYSQAGRR